MKAKFTPITDPDGTVWRTVTDAARLADRSEQIIRKYARDGLIRSRPDEHDRRRIRVREDDLVLVALAAHHDGEHPRSAPIVAAYRKAMAEARARRDA